MSSFVRRMLRGCGLLAIAGLAALAPSAYAEAPADYSAPGEAWNVLPPGEGGSLSPPFPHAFDQIPLYDGLTPRFDNVTNADLATFFKPNIFGLGTELPESTELTPRFPSLKIERDGKGVAHVFGSTRADVMYGAGWVTYEDRAPLMEVLRWPGRLAALDAPGKNPNQIAGEGRQFIPTAATEAFLSKQITLLEEQPGGKQVVEDLDNYLQGINFVQDQARKAGAPVGPPWTRNDVIAVAAFVGGNFGVGGGDEARRAQFLSTLQLRLGKDAGLKAFNDLREQNDPEAPVSVPRTFSLKSGDGKGNAVIDPGSIGSAAVQAAATAQASHAKASNALLLGAKRSQNGHPLLVAGPQVGYMYPESFDEIDLHGGGIDARGVAFAGSGPWLQIGRGADFSWSATSSSTDIIDQYVETLCGGSDIKYLFNGKCTNMTQFSAGMLSGPGGSGTPETVSFNETVHGPVSGYALSNGHRVAISKRRSTRGREVLSVLGFADLTDGAVHGPASFIAAVSKIEVAANWFYADNKNIAMFSGGRVPIRADGVDLGLPTIGTGKFEWQGLVPASQHPQAVNPSGNMILNWNNKPAAGWTAADNEWAYGSIHRVQLLENAVARHSKYTLGSLVGAMNRAATQDLRDALVLPAIEAVLRTSPAPSARERQMLALLRQWRTEGSSRLDRNETGKITAPGAAIMDKAWPKIANAVMAPILGPQLEELASLIPRDDPANSGGGAFYEGWYGYVYKDLRTLLGESGLGGKGEESGEGAFKTRFCGAGNLAACRSSLWMALKEAGDELEAVQGPDPTKWQADANPERITFAEGFPTMRWTNRSTFQQAISFAGHR